MQYPCDNVASDAYACVAQVTKTAVVAGHYAVADHMRAFSSSSPTEVESFRLGCELVAQARQAGRQALLVLLVNDIGIPLTARYALKQSHGLPENYQSMLQNRKLSPADVEVFYESTLRNRASTLLRELYRKSPTMFERVSAGEKALVRCVDSQSCAISREARTAYVIHGPEDLRLVVKEGSNPKCNLILATMYNDISNRIAPDLIINVFNEIYDYRLSLGQYVARYLFDLRTPMLTMLCESELTEGFGEEALQS